MTSLLSHSQLTVHCFQGGAKYNGGAKTAEVGARGREKKKRKSGHGRGCGGGDKRQGEEYEFLVEPPDQ